MHDWRVHNDIHSYLIVSNLPIFVLPLLWIRYLHLKGWKKSYMVWQTLFPFYHLLCWVDLENEIFWVNPFLSRNSSNALFSKFHPWSTTNCRNKISCFSLYSSTKPCKVRESFILWVEKIIRVNLKRPSTITKTYFFT